MSSRAGSRRRVPGCADAGRRAAREIAAFDDLDDDHGAAATRAWRANVRRFGGRFVCGRRRDREQLTSVFEMGLAGAGREQPVMADAMEPARQTMQQEAADEIIGSKRHHLLAIRGGLAINLVAERDVAFVEPDEPTVRHGDAVGVARQVAVPRRSAYDAGYNLRRHSALPTITREYRMEMS